MDDQQMAEALQSMATSCADIQRWLLLGALKGSVSRDRREDIKRAAERIVRLVVNV